MLRQCALELVLEDHTSVLFVFEEIEDRDEVHDVILEQPRLVLLERQQSPLFMNQQVGVVEVDELVQMALVYWCVGW